MVKIIGFKPQATTLKLIEKFEDEVVIRHNNQPLVGSVYVDMQEHQWAVAFAYNYSRKPGIHGHENPLEVRYSCPREECTSIRMFRSDTPDEETLATEPLQDADEFVKFALTKERSFVGKVA